jgi:hypothetical protein
MQLPCGRPWSLGDSARAGMAESSRAPPFSLVRPAGRTPLEVLRGWFTCFRLTGTKGVLEELGTIVRAHRITRQAAKW